MCGIAGIVHFDGRNVDKNEILEFTNSLSHRGPDGIGIWIENNIAFGHTRLAIFDLSPDGNCPMHYNSLKSKGRVLTITYNGEIYNFIELKRFLESKGYYFRTETDTEVILASYDFWKENCLLSFNGMWAFAIYDPENHTLFISRDRFGKKPLYYSFYNKSFYFASELKAFLKLKNFKLELNFDAAKYLLNNPAKYEGRLKDTLIKNIKKLLPGHYLKVDLTGHYEITRWWNTSEHLVEVPVNYNKQVAIFKELLFDAIRLRLRSDVPVATSLSGGLDSSSIVSSVNFIKNEYKFTKYEKINLSDHKVYSAIFQGSSINEEKYARKVVEKLNINYKFIVISKDVTINQILDSIWIMEEVYHGCALPPIKVYESMKSEGVKVTLDGHGGDELLGGYITYYDVPYKNLNDLLFHDFHFDILPAILRNFDRSSMANGVEVRMPFLDWRLVTYVFSLPIESKCGFGFTKRILRDAMRGLVPDEILKRHSKIGFNAPLVEWFNSLMIPLIERIMNSTFWVDNPFWDGKQIKKIVLEKCKNKSWSIYDWDYILNVWTKINFVVFLKMFVENQKDSLYD